jgi:hypothetical protein
MEAPVPTAIRIHGGIVADPAMVASTASAIKPKNSDLTAVCLFVAIGLIVALIATLALPLDQDAVAVLAQFG